MLAQELISEEIPILRPSDSIAQALDWMDEFKVTHLPVTKEAEFLGIIDESTLLSADDPHHHLSKLSHNLIMAFASVNSHVFEVVKRVSEHRLSVIPVLDEKNLFLGAVSVHFLMETIADMPVVKNPGAIVVLEMSLSDYSLFEISRIVEENGAKILGSFITRFPESTKMELTIKINRDEIQDILQSFERYDYHITASYDKSSVKEDLKDRYDQLMKYMNL